MDDILAVNGLEAFADLIRDIERLAWRETPHLGDEIRQGVAFQILHAQVMNAFSLPEVVNTAHVRVAHQLSELELTSEPNQHARFAGQVFADELDGDRPTELPIVGLVNNPHASFTEVIY